ncbi:MAG: hypothetical protein MR598_00685 [Erysipelotrichaceae bacterium]|nr:hypothetical protein [Erysipelotrichaceae bacterium]
MENNQNSKETLKKENQGRGLFYGVIAIATFIIMAVGATFAYFTATTNSMNSAVQTGSTTLQLQYISYGAAWMKKDLIPADTAVVEFSFENQNDTTISDETNMSNTLCKDDFGNSICSVYVFQVTNSANSPQSVSLNVVSEENGFTSLNAMAYEIVIPEDRTDYDSTENFNGDGDPVFRKNSEDETDGAIDVVDGEGTLLEDTVYNAVYVNRKGVQKNLLKWVESRDTEQGTVVKKPAIDRLLVQITEDNQYAEPAVRTAKIADDITIEGKETKTIALVLYIKNANVDQTATDAAKNFTGQVIVSSGDGTTGVSGTITASIGNENDLQSNQP